MPAHDINGVPVAMFFATHFYFSLYHGLSNLILRKIVTTYEVCEQVQVETDLHILAEKPSDFAHSSLRLFSSFDF